MNDTNLPPRWRARLAAWIHQKTGTDRDHLLAGDFPLDKKLVLKFEDGSRASFNFAIVIKASDIQEAGVFTEHCGYHIFGLPGLRISSTD